MAADRSPEDQTTRPPRRLREPWDVAIRRLAREAEAHGIAIYTHTSPAGCTRAYATSQSEPGTVHEVTLLSCDCRGFAEHQRCRHLARLLDITGNLPGRDDGPEPPTPPVVLAKCPNCLGGGWVGEEEAWCGPCRHCDGRGVIRIHWTDPVTLTRSATEVG